MIKCRITFQLNNCIAVVYGKVTLYINNFPRLNYLIGTNLYPICFKENCRI